MKAFKSPYILFLMLFLPIVGCNNKEQETLKKPDNSENPIEEPTQENEVHLNTGQLAQVSIKLVSPDSSVVHSSLKVNGTIELPPKGRFSVSVPYGGFVKRLNLLPGSVVKKGQPLMVIENPEFITMQQNYLKAKSRHEYLKAEYERQISLHEDNISSTKLYQETKSDFLANQADLKGFKAQLNLIGMNAQQLEQGDLRSSVSVFSPIHGKVKSVLVNNGAYVNPQDVILEIYDLKEMHAELQVYENDLKNLNIGDQVQIENPLNPEEKLRAKIFLIGAGVDEDRVMNVHAEFTELNPDLVPGTFISALIEVEPIQALVLPENAIVRYAGDDYVFVLKDSTQHEQVYDMRQVKTGRQEGEMVEIMKTSWLSEKTKVVVEGAYDLLGVLKNKEE